ncbi:MAG: hypothetical protein MJY75_00580 [Bacteroidaceae bacterium]|nr:hypothetical protein [Bacteroidaceae bacterium]
MGDDRYGEHATIRNEDVLFFEKECYNRKVVINAMGTEIDQEVVLFKASASEPLKIDLPLLGYELYVDLVTFEDEEVLDQPELSILLHAIQNGEEGKE